MPRTRSNRAYEQHVEEWMAMYGNQEECSCVWKDYRVVETCSSCISLGHLPVCGCAWRALRGRSYKTRCCTDCKSERSETPWKKQIRIVHDHLAAIADAADINHRLHHVLRLFSYMYAEPAFVRSNAKFQAIVLAKAKEFRADERAIPISPFLDQVIAFYESC